MSYTQKEMYACSEAQHKADTSYQPQEEEEEVDEAFFKQLTEASKMTNPVLLEDFSYRDICWEGNTELDITYLECVADNVLYK